MLVVTVVTAAFILVLSFFNGMEELIRKLYNTFDPEIKITAVKGKSFEVDSLFLKKIKKIDGVYIITEVIEDNAILTYKEQRDVIKIKGVSDNFIAQHRMDSMMVAGTLKLKEKDKYFAIIGSGVQYKLSISLNSVFTPLNFYYPNRKKIRKPDAPDAFNTASITPGGVFAIEKQYDDSYVFVPLEFAEELLDYGNKRTSLEVKVKDGYDIDGVRDEIRKVLGKDFVAHNSDEQHSGLLRAVKIERLAVYIILCSLLAVSSVGIYFCLTMLTIQKKKDISIMRSFGASSEMIRNIFLKEGVMIAFTGATIGLTVGFIICYIQQESGLISMGMQTAVVDSYPVKMNPMDFITTALVVFVLTLVASYRPASKAAKIDIREEL